MSTESKIDIYEKNGSETNAGARSELIVKSHWNRKAMVVIVLPGKNGESVTVDADQLKRAIANAQNAHSY